MEISTVRTNLLLLVLFASAVLTFASSPPQGKLRFAEMVDASGITYRNISGDAEKRFIHGSLGSGAGLMDYDQDGDLDVYFVNGAGLDGTRIVEAGPNRLYRNEGNWSFRDVTEQAGVAHSGWGVGCTVGDYDNDGLSDLYVTNIGANVLFRKQGDGTFRNATNETGVGHPVGNEQRFLRRRWKSRSLCGQLRRSRSNQASATGNRPNLPVVSA